MTDDKLNDLLYKYRQLIRQESERKVSNSERFEVEAQFNRYIYDVVMELVGEKNDKKTMKILNKQFGTTGTLVGGEIEHSERDIFYQKIGYDQAIDEIRQKVKERLL